MIKRYRMMKKTTYAWRKKVSFFIKLHSKLAAFSPFVRIPSMITKKSSPWNKVRESLSPCPCITPKFCYLAGLITAHCI